MNKDALNKCTHVVFVTSLVEKSGVFITNVCELVKMCFGQWSAWALLDANNILLKSNITIW